VLTVSIPIKIWNNARIEHRSQEQEKLLLAAKVEALKSQINPHFLFNTLTSVSSLIRSQPETARMVIVKLSGLLRKLMRSTSSSSRCARSWRPSTSTWTSKSSASARG
jgi:two-component system, LytTR family, sensor kinase